MGKKACIKHRFYDENVVILNLVCKIHKNEKKIGKHFFHFNTPYTLKKHQVFASTQICKQGYITAYTI